MGCSIGGRIVLDLALKHAKELRALIGLQTGVCRALLRSIVARSSRGARRARLRRGGLWPDVAAQPGARVWETVWHYMQGGPGVFTGDLHFYQIEGDIRGRIGEIDTKVCPLYCLTGEYDYSASPRDTEAAVARIPGRQVHGDERPRAFPDERKPRGLPRLPQAGPGRNP